jgi:NitT/TauT family transport system ATP-binding protein
VRLAAWSTLVGIENATANSQADTGLHPDGRPKVLAQEATEHATSSVTGRRPKIVVEGLRKEYARRGRHVHTVFESLNLTVWENEFISIVGPSGCGKTTLLNMLAGLTPPTGGRILENDRPITGPGRERGVIFQQDAIFMWRTVRKNVSYGLETQKVPRAERQTRVDHYLRLVGLENFADFYPKELSGGMKKRVAIATVLANQPDVLLMDEPFGSLDYPSKIALQEEVLRIWEAERTTTVFVTHDIEEALYLSDRVIVLVAGRLAEELQVSFPRPRTPELRASAEMLQMKERLWKYMIGTAT